MSLENVKGGVNFGRLTVVSQVLWHFLLIKTTPPAIHTALLNYSKSEIDEHEMTQSYHFSLCTIEISDFYSGLTVNKK